MHESPVALRIAPLAPKRLDVRIGIVGAGFIVRAQQLPAYRSMGFRPHAITSLNRAESDAVAGQFDIPKAYDSWQELLRDEDIEVLDIAVPPDCQLEIVREAVKRPHIRGILCQKPLAMNLAEAIQIVRCCEEAGVKLGVNSNMRYDPSIRAAKSLLEDGLLGTPVLAQIDMHAIPHWQKYLQKYDRIEILNMGIHHVDTFRYLFGDPKSITALARTDPRTDFPHIDGITTYTFQYEDELMATSLDDVWAWPGEGCENDFSIGWRVVGMEGIAKGKVFWYIPEPVPSEISFTLKRYPNQWYTPALQRSWFPDAFQGMMAQLLRALEEDKEPEISGRDNLKTIASVEACYRSVAERRTVELAEILTEYGI